MVSVEASCFRKLCLHSEAFRLPKADWVVETVDKVLERCYLFSSVPYFLLLAAVFSRCP